MKMTNTTESPNANLELVQKFDELKASLIDFVEANSLNRQNKYKIILFSPFVRGDYLKGSRLYTPEWMSIIIRDNAIYNGQLHLNNPIGDLDQDFILYPRKGSFRYADFDLGFDFAGPTNYILDRRGAKFFENGFSSADVSYGHSLHYVAKNVDSSFIDIQNEIMLVDYANNFINAQTTGSFLQYQKP